MELRASAPGKLVVLGEYAVLEGAPALAMAVDRRAQARIVPSPDGRVHVEARLGTPAAVTVAPGAVTGLPLIDLVCASTAGTRVPPPWHAILDSSAFFASGTKLGLGSSAAALCAWAGAWAAYGRSVGLATPEPALATLIEAHRAFQGGAGSGIDVAAAYTGGLITFRLEPGGGARVSSVQVPNSVGFAGVFTGTSASTPGLVAHFKAWAARDAQAAGRLQRMLGGIAAAGCAAVVDGDSRGFLAAVEEYGTALESLGAAMGADIVTAEHRRVRGIARESGVVYKTSGAGGGDVGLALSPEPDAMTDFTARAAGLGYRVVHLGVDQRGLVIGE